MEQLRNSQIGRPKLSPQEIDSIYRKLEPSLKTGLSINKACLQAQIPSSTVYDLQRENTEFAGRIDIAKNYYSVLVSNIITKLLEVICKKQKNFSKNKLTAEEIRFVQWVALNSNSTKEEFGRKDEEEEKDTSPFSKIANDPKSLITVLHTYEVVRARMIEENKYSPDGEEGETAHGSV